MASQIGDIVLRAAVIYVIVLVGLRLLGKSHLSQLSIFDFVLVLLLSNAVQNAMVGNDSSPLGGIVAAATLIGLNYVLTFLMFRFRKVDTLLQGAPTLLIHDGQIIREHLDREMITVEELTRVIREHGVAHIADVRNAIMEIDGTISVIPRSGEEKRVETFKQRRTKYQHRKI